LVLKKQIWQLLSNVAAPTRQLINALFSSALKPRKFISAEKNLPQKILV
jgi:hypothetical protein